jgi:salicylate hydroxylase
LTQPLIIAGGGIGGMALAAALGRHGVRSIVVEQAETLGEVGAGLQLSPNAMRGLAALGLEDAVRAVGFAPDAVEMRDHASGRLLLRNTLGAEAERRWGAPYLTVHRADLHRLLTEAARPYADVRLGETIVAVADGGVRLATGEPIKGEAVVGCDGVRSTVRQALFGDGRARFTGQVAWRFVVPIEGPPPRIVRVWTGSRQHFVCYPTRNGAVMNVVAVTEEADWLVESWSEPGDKAVLRTAFKGWPAEALALIGGAADLHRWALHDRPPLPRWSKGAATLLGDAAHPMLPFLAQGAAMAIEDAAVLADKLSQTSDTAEALRLYETARAPRTAKVQAWSRRNARLFHLPSPLAAGVFGAAAALDAFTPGGGARRFDWLYGYDATGGGG